MNSQNNTLAVIGLGYVGLPLALLADRKGYRVIGIDINKQKIDQIKKRIAPFKDERITSELPYSSIEATDDFAYVAEASIIAICVPTPVYENHMPNLEPIESAARAIAPHLSRKTKPLVILESTVNPGVSENILLPILETVSGLKVNKDFYLAHCPERINPGDPKWHVENINRVIGSLDNTGLKKASAFYRSLLTAEIMEMQSLKEAEAVKVVENSFRDINIAFVNELAQSFSKIGIDVVNVINGAKTKPFAFMAHYPGCGVGGHCIPVDPYYLIEYAKKNGFDHDFLSLARRINNSMPQYTTELVVKALSKKQMALNGASIAVLGLAYKSDIGDYRESPSFEIIKHLEERGAIVSTFDPYVLEKSSAASLEEALEDAACVVIATAHKEFRELAPEFFKTRGIDAIVDGRNCLPKEKFGAAGIIYEGIGRTERFSPPLPLPKKKSKKKKLLEPYGSKQSGIAIQTSS